ncbi:MAG: aldehyde dehydrogenase family protein, partial [Thaumarchaeota archaeon]|nr:aldehyde dehydrogenase family protein [Nitrososphaerota archaeon]
MKAIIGQEFVDTEKRIQVIEPATGNVLDEIPNLSLDQVRQAIDIAYTTLSKVQSLTVAARSALLRKVAEMIRSKICAVLWIYPLELFRGLPRA